MKTPAKIIALLVALTITVGLLLGACGSDADADGKESGTNQSDVTEKHVTLDDGREVTCLVWEGYKRGGFSCDWQTAR